MRPLHALLNAMRKRRTRRIDLDEADRLAAGDPPGPEHPGLGDLLDALRAPGTPEELTAEKATAAAFTANRKRAARAARRNARNRPPLTRAIAIPLAIALALLALGGTALAARTGNLPAGAQQHAHRLFSALGIPAPRTGTTSHPSPTPPILALTWCDDWRAAHTSNRLTTETRRKLIAAAGSEADIPAYCARLRNSLAPSGTAPRPALTRSPAAATPTPAAPHTSPSQPSRIPTPPSRPHPQ